MKRVLALALCICLALTGCKSAPNDTESQVIEPASYVYPEEYASMDDAELVDGLEESVYESLVSELDSDDYLVEDVEVSYVSQEYLDELSSNSKANIFFGYSLEEVIDHFGGTPYVFTNDGGSTVVREFESYDDTWEQVATNVAMGAGVIVVCATVTAVAPAAGAPTAVTAIFTFATNGAVIGSAIDASVSGTVTGIMKGIETGDAGKAIKAAMLGASEGFKSGAIIGAATGGAAEGLGLLRATRNGLTMSEAAEIQMESKLPLQIIQDMRNMEEYEIYKSANLEACTMKTAEGTRTVLARDLDMKIVDNNGLTNRERMLKGMNPIDENGISFEYHHVGQKNDGALALLTRSEHDMPGLHFGQESEIERQAFNSERVSINKYLAELYPEAA